MKSGVFKDFKLLLHGHDKTVIRALIKTYNQFKVGSLNGTAQTVSKEGLILLPFSKLVQIVEINTKDSGDRSAALSGIIDFCTSNIRNLIQTPVSHVFQRFWRGDLPSAREHGRSGLGLAIVRQIAEGHGGQATVRSTVGVGSTFTIWLPRYVDR